MQHAWPLLISAAILGLRHGFDWDHIAAIMDIVGTNAEEAVNMPAQVHALVLSAAYALGHASVVMILGICALCFAAVLPNWVDPLVERLVGCTLLFLGVWVFLSLLRHFQGKENFHLRSRWMLVFALSIRIRDWIWSELSGRKLSAAQNVGQYGFRTSFGVGMIHGIGAETGTQVLLIAAIGGAASHGLGTAMLISFVIGLLVSNTLVAVVGTTGFTSSTGIKPLYLTAGVLTCVFSLTVGSYFVAGCANNLPDLQHLMGAG